MLWKDGRKEGRGMVGVEVSGWMNKGGWRADDVTDGWMAKWAERDVCEACTLAGGHRACGWRKDGRI